MDDRTSRNRTRALGIAHMVASSHWGTQPAPPSIRGRIFGSSPVTVVDSFQGDRRARSQAGLRHVRRDVRRRNMLGRDNRAKGKSESLNLRLKLGTGAARHDLDASILSEAIIAVIRPL